MSSIRPYLKRLVLDAGIIPGHRDYIKFIILSRSRTGSEYLRSLLNSHGQISVFGELFKQEDHFNWDYPGYYRSRKKREGLEENPVLFLEREIFRKYPKKQLAVGFKIFYYHAQTDNWKSVWTYLQDQKDLKVIHLTRQNILETHLSRKRANGSGKWINLTGEKDDVQPVILDYAECLEDFTKTRQWEEQSRTFFDGHARLEVQYENLLDENHAVLQNIQRFLTVDEKDLRSITHKQSHKPLSKSIANYLELKEKFKDTEWADFFAE